MFGLPLSVIGLVALAGFAAAAVLYALMMPSFQADKARNRRFANLQAQKTDTVSRRADMDRAQEGQKRRKQITESLSEIEEKAKSHEKDVKKPSLKVQILQAGLKIDIRTFYIYSIACGVVVFLLAFIFQVQLLYCIGAAFAAGFGLPRWILSSLRKRRVKAFLAEFPNSIDIIVRAIRSGLPLNDGLRLIATESREPVRAEFRRIVEAQQMGISVADACLACIKQCRALRRTFSQL